MKKFGFRSVYRHKEIPLIYCKLGIDDKTKRVWFNVCDSDGRLFIMVNMVKMT